MKPRKTHFSYPGTKISYCGKGYDWRGHPFKNIVFTDTIGDVDCLQCLRFMPKAPPKESRWPARNRYQRRAYEDS